MARDTQEYGPVECGSHSETTYLRRRNTAQTGSGRRNSRSSAVRSRNGSGRATATIPERLTTSAAKGSGSLGDRVYQALKRDIITGVFQSGEALTEKNLAKRYRGSRTPVREAAVRLQQENLLRIVPNRGYFVRHITI